MRVFGVRSFVVALISDTKNIADRRDMQIQVPGNLALPIPISLDSLNHLFVTLQFVTEYALLEYFFKCRSVCIPLTPRYLWHLPVLL